MVTLNEKTFFKFFGETFVAGAMQVSSEFRSSDYATQILVLTMVAISVTTEARSDRVTEGFEAPPDSRRDKITFFRYVIHCNTWKGDSQDCAWRGWEQTRRGRLGIAGQAQVNQTVAPGGIGLAASRTAAQTTSRMAMPTFAQTAMDGNGRSGRRGCS